MLNPDQGRPGRAPQGGQVLRQQQEAERDHPEPQEGQDAEDADIEQGSGGDARMVAVRMAADADFEAVEAADATAAVRILGERLDVRVVLTDIDAPGGLDGTGIAAAVCDRWPPIKIILTSGHVAPSRAKRAVFLPKPYGEEQVVAEMLRLTA